MFRGLAIIGLAACVFGCESKQVSGSAMAQTRSEPALVATPTKLTPPAAKNDVTLTRVPTHSESTTVEIVKSGKDIPNPQRIVSGPGKRTKKLSKDDYEVSATMAPGKRNHSATVTVTITPKGKYKLNDEFPTKVKFTATGATPAATTIKKKDAKSFDSKKAVFSLQLKPAGKKYNVSCQARFAVCTDSECVPKKAELTVASQ